MLGGLIGVLIASGLGLAIRIYNFMSLEIACLSLVFRRLKCC